MRLLADCGNTAIKLALTHDGGVWTHERLDAKPEALSGFARPHREAIAELVVLPGSNAHTMMLRRWWLEFCSGKPLRTIGAEIPLPDLGQYPGCGADRILAGLVACRQQGKPVVVVDAGTATTLTAWRFDAKAEPARRIAFLGGLIAPGAKACSVGLSALAPALPVVEPLGPTTGALQHDTHGAIAAAIGIGYGPMIGACLERVRMESGIEDVVLTGGNASQMIEAGIASRLAYRPSLVLEGMEELCRG